MYYFNSILRLFPKSYMYIRQIISISIIIGKFTKYAHTT